MNKEEILAKSQQEFQKKKKQDERELTETAKAGNIAAAVGRFFALLIVLLDLIANTAGIKTDYIIVCVAWAVVNIIDLTRYSYLYKRLRRTRDLLFAIPSGTVFALAFVVFILKLFKVL